MGKAATLAVRIIADEKGAVTGLRNVDKAAEKTTSRFERFDKGMAAAAGPAAAIGGAIALLAKKSFDAASSLEQSTGAIQSVFAEHAQGMEDLASRAAQDVGLAKNQYQEMATVIGSQLTNMGVPMSELGGETDKLIKLGADLAATYGGATTDAVAALSSLMRGERDPIERYGVSINQAAVDAKVAEMGLQDLTGEAKKNAQMQATLALLTQQTSAAHGAFAREADTAAGQQQRMNAEMQDAMAAIGESLLPLVMGAAKAFQGLAQWMQQNAETVRVLALVLGGMAAAVLAVNGAMAAYRTATTIAAGAQALFSAALWASPITWIIAGIVALIVVIVLVIKHWDQVKSAARSALDGIAHGVGWARGRIEDFANAAARFIKRLTAPIVHLADLVGRGLGFDGLGARVARQIDIIIARVRDLLVWLGNAMIPPWLHTIAGLRFSQQIAPAATSLAPAQFAVSATPATTRSLSRRAGVVVQEGDTYHITIEGAIDPVGTADRIAELMNRRARRLGTIRPGQAVL